MRENKVQSCEKMFDINYFNRLGQKPFYLSKNKYIKGLILGLKINEKHLHEKIYYIFSNYILTNFSILLEVMCKKPEYFNNEGVKILSIIVYIKILANERCNLGVDFLLYSQRAQKKVEHYRNIMKLAENFSFYYFPIFSPILQSIFNNQILNNIQKASVKSMSVKSNDYENIKLCNEFELLITPFNYTPNKNTYKTLTLENQDFYDKMVQNINKKYPLNQFGFFKFCLLSKVEFEKEVKEIGPRQFIYNINQIGNLFDNTFINKPPLSLMLSYLKKLLVKEISLIPLENRNLNLINFSKIL